jgi:hypothetical protein
MKKNAFSVSARVIAATPFVIFGTILLALSTIYGGSRGRTIAPQPDAPMPTQFSGTYTPAIFPCGTPLHHFTVPAGQTRLVVQTSAVVPTNDYSLVWAGCRSCSDSNRRHGNIFGSSGLFTG